MNELTCPKCGGDDTVHATQFDHPDGETVIDVMRCLSCNHSFPGDTYKKTAFAPDHWYKTELTRRLEKFNEAHEAYAKACNAGTANYEKQKQATDAAYYLALYLTAFAPKLGLIGLAEVAR